MADVLSATHKAIYDTLRVNLTTPVYDYVPEDAVYPYVELTRHISVPADMLVERKEQFTTYLTVWSEYKGQKEVLEILDSIYDLVHQKQLPTDTGRMVRCYVDNRDTARDMDDLTFTGNMKLATLIEH